MSHFDIPASDMAAYRCISINRLNLRTFFEEFQRSVALFELLERGGGPPSTGVLGGQFVQWRIIAARDGALNIYHFGCSLKAVQKQLPTCPALAAKVDSIAVRNAESKFREYFRNIDSVRHAIAHAGELLDTPYKITRHSQQSHHEGHGFSSSAGGLLAGALYERVYSVGAYGRVFSVNMDGTSLAKMADIIRLVDLAFEGPSAQTAQPPES